MAISDQNKNILERRMFDAWGNLVKLQNATGQFVINNGQTLIANYKMLTERGFTGHEHLFGIGLINMNGRLYDPKLHRFLMPDNNLQDPSNSQNYNRYAYVLNNPLMIIDPTGESFWSDLGDFFVAAGVAIIKVVVVAVTIVVAVIGIAVGLVVGTVVGICQYVGTGYSNRSILDNQFKIIGGLFQNPGGKSIKELPQTLLGLGASLGANGLGRVKSVSYYGGATVVQHYQSGWGGFTLGSYINGDSSIAAVPGNYLFQHEYGHYLQSQNVGWNYMYDYALPSLFSKGEHKDYYTERDANARSFIYFNENVQNFNSNGTDWNQFSYPIDGYNWSKPFKDVANQLSLFNNIRNKYNYWLLRF